MVNPGKAVVENKIYYDINRWKAYYGQDVNSVEGSPTLSGGASPTTVSGFALSPVSIGYQSASDGKDIGADVSLVGIGDTSSVHLNEEYKLPEVNDDIQVEIKIPRQNNEEYKLPEVNDDIVEIMTLHQSPEVVWLPQEIDLNKHTKGPFTVKVQVKGFDERRNSSIFPRIHYYIGTGRSHGYFDMINEGDNVWSFDIPDPQWFRYRANSLHYHVKLFDEEGAVISESRWEIELIDSFIQSY